MNTRRTALLMALGASILVPGAARAAPALDSRAPLTPGATEPRSGVELRTLLKQVVAAGVPGVVARVQDGRSARTFTAGVSDLTTGAPLLPGTRFRAGSTTKTFVATVVLQLVGEGRLALDDPVGRWLPGLVPDGDTITVRQLLNHTSGLYDHTADPAIAAGIVENRVFAPSELLAVTAAHPLSFAPGTGWQYSNSNYVVAGLLVEAVTGHSLGRELRRRIFEPLGLESTSFPVATGRMPGRHAHGYLSTDLVPPTDGKPLDVTGINPSWAWAAGALVTDARDLARFYRALQRGELLAPRLLAEMRTTVRTPDGSRVPYGLGLFRISTPCGTFWGHNGGMPGYHTEAFWSKDADRTVVLATTMGPAPPAAAEDAFLRALDVALCGR